MRERLGRVEELGTPSRAYVLERGHPSVIQTTRSSLLAIANRVFGKGMNMPHSKESVVELEARQVGSSPRGRNEQGIGDVVALLWTQSLAAG